MFNFNMVLLIFYSNQLLGSMHKVYLTAIPDTHLLEMLHHILPAGILLSEVHASPLSVKNQHILYL